jgi:RNA recognition motif-containing protein
MESSQNGNGRSSPLVPITATHGSMKTTNEHDGSRRIIVQGLPLGTSWQDLKDLMRQATVKGQQGNVLRCDVTPFHESCQGHVVFEKQADADVAVEMFNQSLLQGNHLTVQHDQSQRNQAVQESRQVFVSNLPYALRWQELKTLFETIGKVIRCDIVFGPKGRSKGMGVVVMESSVDAALAVEQLSNREISGRNMQVRLDRLGHLSHLSHQLSVDTETQNVSKPRRFDNRHPPAPLPSVYIDSSGQVYYVTLSPSHMVNPTLYSDHVFTEPYPLPFAQIGQLMHGQSYPAEFAPNAFPNGQFHGNFNPPQFAQSTMGYPDLDSQAGSVSSFEFPQQEIEYFKSSEESKE